jgi:SHS2 domain-containing protein
MKIWQPLEHTADFAFRIFGRNEEELFQNARLAFYEAIFDKIPKTEVAAIQIIELHSSDQSLLLIDWLRKMHLLLCLEHTILKEVTFVKLTEYSLTAECRSAKLKVFPKEPFIKAITYHNAKIKGLENKCWIDVVCDV